MEKSEKIFGDIKIEKEWDVTDDGRARYHITIYTRYLGTMWSLRKQYILSMTSFYSSDSDVDGTTTFYYYGK